MKFCFLSSGMVLLLLIGSLPGRGSEAVSGSTLSTSIETHLPARSASSPYPQEKPGSQALLLGSEKVRNTLKLSSLQRTVLNSIREEYHDAIEALGKEIQKNTLSGPHHPQKHQLYQQLEILTEQYDQRALSVLNPRQKSRLYKIEQRTLGGLALYSQKIRHSLELSSQQEHAIAKEYHHWQHAVEKINRAYEKGKLTPYERLLQLHQDRLKRSAALLKILTLEQYDKFFSIHSNPP